MGCLVIGSVGCGGGVLLCNYVCTSCICTTGQNLEIEHYFLGTCTCTAVSIAQYTMRCNAES